MKEILSFETALETEKECIDINVEIKKIAELMIKPPQLDDTRQYIQNIYWRFITDSAEWYADRCSIIVECMEKTVGRLEGLAIKIDACPICSGFWFDRGELNEVLKLNYKVVKTAQYFAAHKHTEAQKEKRIKCPRCRTKMEQIPSLRDHRIIMDGCPKCGGVWLDWGELDMLQRGGYIKRLFNRISKFFLGGGREEEIGLLFFINTV